MFLRQTRGDAMTSEPEPGFEWFPVVLLPIGWFR